jgi:serine/threonine-protein kinase
MEFLEGEPLNARLDRLGTLNVSQTASIVQQVSRALARAHKSGIVHRDLKPENIFLVWDDEDQTDVAKVVDFGIAKFTDQDAGISSSTKTGSLMGTPYYMSPEQARGLKGLDARSDNWSLGVIAYEALTGVRPFNGEAVGDLLVKICTVDPSPPTSLQPSLPPSIDAWMKKALDRDPEGRFQDVREMAESLITVSGMPGRSTLGSSVGMDDTTGITPGGRATPVATKGHGSPKMTSGAVTHAAVGVDAPFLPPVRKTSPLVFVGMGALLLVSLGMALSLGGGEEATREADATPKDEQSAAASTGTMGAVEQPQPVQNPEPAQAPAQEAEAPKEPTETAAVPVPPPAPRPSSTPRPAPRPAARPQPVAQPAPRIEPAPEPAPRAAPEPAPRPAPRPSPRPSGVDIGY